MLDDLQTQSPSPAAPAVPPRRKWLKRFAIAGVAYVVGLVLLRVWWGFAAQRALDRQIAEYRAAGQLVFASEFDAQLDAVEPSENAAVLYERAMKKYVVSSASGVLLPSFLDDPQAYEKHAAVADELMNANSEALRLVHEARRRPHVAWSDRLDTSMVITGLHTSQRMLSRILWFASTYQERTGDHATSVRMVADSVAFSDAIGAHPSIIASMVAWACHDLNFSWIEDHASDLAISGAGTGLDVQTSAASRADVEAIVNALLSEDHLRSDVIRGSHGSRAQTLGYQDTRDWFQSLVAQTNPWAPGSTQSRMIDSATRPALELDLIRAMQYESVVAVAVVEQAWPQASRHFSEVNMRPTLIHRLTHPITYTAFGFAYASSSQILKIFYKHLARRRMAALALAVRMYEADHGKRPLELAALVPVYLDVVPRDPFANQDQILGYAPNAERPLLYSVGMNGEDNNGDVPIQPDGRIDMKRSDIPFYLEPKPPDVSGIETEDHHENVKNAERKKSQQSDSKSDPDQGKPKR